MDNILEKIIVKMMSAGSNLLWAFVILIVGAAAIGIFMKFARKALKRTSLDEAIHTFILNVIKILLWIIVAVAFLAYLGIQTSTFVTILAAAGAAAALALKDSLGNISGGILLLVNKPFVKDDFVDIGGTTGKVDKIDMLVTTLKTLDNKVISVPNGIITTSVITNYSREETRRVDCVFRIAYASSIGKAKDTILAVTEANPMILQDPEPYIVVSSQDEHAVNVSCYVWCQSADYWSVKYFLEENVKIAFDEANISVPYPQIDVHIVK